MLVINYLINFEPSQHCDSLGLWRDEDEVAMRPNLKTRSSKSAKKPENKIVQIPKMQSCSEMPMRERKTTFGNLLK